MEGVEAHIHRVLAEFGVDKVGREWILKALHPAGPEKSPGLPDQSATPVLRPDFRIEQTISGPPGATAWDCMMWIPPGDVNALYWVAGQSPCDFNSSTPPTSNVTCGQILLQGYNLTDGTLSYNWCNVGTLSPTQFNALTSLPGLKTNAFRHQYKSVTVTQIAAATSDQGTVYAAQFPPAFRQTGCVDLSGYNSGVTIPGSSPPKNYDLIAGHYTCVLPAQESDLTAMAPDFYMDASREGVYMPLRLAGPSQPFVRTEPLGCPHQAGGLAGAFQLDVSHYPIGALVTPRLNLPISTASQLPWPFELPVQGGFNSGTLQLPNYQAFDTGYDSTNCGVIIFRGLNGAANGTATTLQVKVLAGLEIAPDPLAPDRIFTETAAPYLPRALEAYYTLCLRLDDAYPSNFNSLEGIWDAIKDVASKVWDRVEPNIVSAASGGLNSLIRMGAARLGARMRAPTSAPLVHIPRAPALAVSLRARKPAMAKTRPKRRVKVRG